MEKLITKSDIYYEEFLSNIYDDTPYFGQGRSRELDKFNGFYYEHLKDEDDRILEFGCGTGMLTIPLARMGHKLDSVDIAPDMQKVVSKKLANESPYVAANVNQVVADAIEFKGPQLYNSLVMPEGVLIAIPDAEMQLGLLDSCYRNLRRGGRIYTDFFQPRYDVIHNKTLTEHSRFRTKDGELYLFTIHYSNNEYTQVQDWHVVFTKIENGEKTEVIEADVRFRYLFYSEIQLMLKQTGFKVIDIDVNYAEGRGFAVIAEKV